MNNLFGDMCKEWVALKTKLHLSFWTNIATDY